MTRGSNTCWLLRDDNLTLANNNQIAQAFEDEEPKDCPTETKDENDNSNKNTVRQSTRAKKQTVRFGFEG